MASKGRIADNDSGFKSALVRYTAKSTAVIRKNIEQNQQRSESKVIKKHGQSTRGRIYENRQARRVRFFRNGDKYFAGSVLAVSHERYRSFDVLLEDITSTMNVHVKLPSAIHSVYDLQGLKVFDINDILKEDYFVCACKTEIFKKMDYMRLQVIVYQQPKSQLPAGVRKAKTTVIDRTKSSKSSKPSGNRVPARMVTIVRNGPRPRKIISLLLNKRNSPSFEHVLTAITELIDMPSGRVEKVFTLMGKQVLKLEDFFGDQVTFFVYGRERVTHPNDFVLDPEEEEKLLTFKKKTYKAKTVQASRKTKKVLAPPPDVDCSQLPFHYRENYIMGETLGKGYFATVVRLTKRSTGDEYALKVLDRRRECVQDETLKSEMDMMTKLNHQFVIKMIRGEVIGMRAYILMPYLNSTLFEEVARHGFIDERRCRVVMYGLLSGLLYLHSIGIVHRDIKTENVLCEIDRHGNMRQLKISDFGLSANQLGGLTDRCGTPTYIAPEIIRYKIYDYRCDFWSAGVMLYVILSGLQPFGKNGDDDETIFRTVLNDVVLYPEERWGKISLRARVMVGRMLKSDPAVRVTSEGIISDLWMVEDRGIEEPLRLLGFDIDRSPMLNNWRRHHGISKAIQTRV